MVSSFAQYVNLRENVVTQISKSLIRFRNMTGVMLAVSAIFAVVASTVSMPGDRAFGQTTSMTNSQKVQSALDAFEAKLADPYFRAPAVTSPPDPGGLVTQLVAAINTLEAALTVDPTVTVELLGNESAILLEPLDPRVFRTPTLSDALTYTAVGSRGTPLVPRRNALTSGRNQMTGALVLADTTFTALKTVDGDGTAGAPVVSLTDATKSTLDRLNESLLRGTADLTDLAAFRTSVEDALQADRSWYPDGFTSYPSGVAYLLNLLLNPTDPVDFNNDISSEVHALEFIRYSRALEARAVAAIKTLLSDIETALEEYEFAPLAEDADDAAKAARAVEETALETARETVAPLIATLTADAEEFNAFDELAVLKTALKSVGVPSSGVTMKRLDAIETALLKDKDDDFDTDNDGTRDALIDGTATDRADQVSKLIDDSLTHIIAALETLSDLDGTDAQKAAIADLDDLLTKVDDLYGAGDVVDDAVQRLTMEDVQRFRAALDAFDALIMALESKHVDTTEIVEVRRYLNAAQFLASNILSFVRRVNLALGRDSAFFDAVKDGILADAIASDDPETPGDDTNTVTHRELLEALKFTYVPIPSHPDRPHGVTGEWLLRGWSRTDDLYATARAMLDLKAELEAASDDIDNTDLENDLSSLSTAMGTWHLQYFNVSRLNATSPETDHIPAKAAAAAYRSSPSTTIMATDSTVDISASTLDYDSFAAMAALLAALDGLEIGELDVTVKVARDALIAAYENREGLANDAESEVSTSYQEIIGTGVGHHAHALNAAFLVVDAALSISGIDENLAIKIRAALATQAPYQQQLQAKITRIEATVRGVTVSAGDKVKLEVIIFGRQDLTDHKLAFGPDGTRGTSDDVTFDWGDASDDTGASITYTAPSSSGTYTVRASLDPNECYHADPDVQAEKCSAVFQVSVRRSTADSTPSDPPANPPGEIPSILTDADGNQYEVFTPVEGGSFNGEGYSISAPAGAVPNGEYIGIRMAQDGAASNAGMTHQRYTLGGNMYEVSAVDASSSVISDYQLSSTATVCLPLPDQLRVNISDLAIVAINADGSLTILSASVRLGPSGISVCGNLSAIPASLAVGSEGAPRGFPTVTPEPTPEVPDTGGTAPSRNAGLWALLLGIAAFAFSSVVLINRRRRTDRPI